MTQLLEKAILALKERPETEQNAHARRILEELESEARWDTEFERNWDAIERMSEEALDEHRAGRTLPLDPDTL